jgi:hypothetical protein
MSGTKREEVTYPCPACGQGVLLITDATDTIVRAVFCRACKTRQTLRLRQSPPAPQGPAPARTVSPAVPMPRAPGPPPIETVRIRDRRG